MNNTLLTVAARSVKLAANVKNISSRVAGETNKAKTAAAVILSDAERDRYEERAAIIEFCGNETREFAESLAKKEIADSRNNRLTP